MIQCFVRKGDHVSEAEPSKISEALKAQEVVVWVNVEAPTPEDGDFLSRTFGFHPLSIEDCISPKLRPPKLDDFGTYLFLVVHGIDHNLPPEMLQTHELDLFIGKNYLVTSHRKTSKSINRTRASCVQKPALMASPDVLAYHIIDGQVDNMLSPVEELERLLTRFKRDTLHETHPSQLSTALDLEERLLKVHWVIYPELRALQALSHKGEPFMRESTAAYFKDIQDHLERLQGMIDVLRDMAQGNLSLYLSVAANRTADFTKALSLVAMMFLPLALVAGIYGMNFKNMPELDWKYGYFTILSLIVAIGAGLVVFYRKKHWI